MKPSFYLDVALLVPVRKTFAYLPLKGTNINNYSVGARVEVPFGNKRLIGIINKIADNFDSLSKDGFTIEKLKSIAKILDQENIFSRNILELVNFSADYYQYALGEVYAACLPSSIKKGNDLAEFENKQVLLNTNAEFLLQNKKLSSAQKKLITFLTEHNGPMSQFSLNHLGVKTTTINSLAKEGWLYLKQDISSESNKLTDILKQKPLELNKEQELAVHSVLEELNIFKSFLLYGITGSGKTEVYLHLIYQLLQLGKQVLVLVPEISLTPQTIKRFTARFHTKIAVVHSKTSQLSKAQDWLAARDGSAKIIIGTRSAIFTPIKDLGLIIIDEEHDLSFKQQEGFRYNARDLAVARAKRLQIPIVLGSATPSIESVANGINNKYQLLKLSTRAGGAVLPKIKLLNIAQKKLQAGLSDNLIGLISQKLKLGEQVLLFINRRGYAPVLKCNDCSWGAMCQRCNVHYTVHRQDGYLSCHYCTSSKPLVRTCPDCGSVNLQSFGVGTEQIEDFLQQQFQDYDCIRIDRDTTKNKSALDQQLNKVNQNKPLILLGTQMLAKGHHFPNVTLVAILDVDNSLFSTDFRAPERLIQLLLQVSGRAGRSSKPSEVIIQTMQPEHPIFHDLLTKDYWQIATELYALRQAALQPPCSFWVLIRAESHKLDKTMEFLELVKSLYLKIKASNNQSNILGPVLAPMQKKAGMFRGQLLVTANNRKVLHANLSKLVDEITSLKVSSIRWSLDVDPQEVY